MSPVRDFLLELGSRWEVPIIDISRDPSLEIIPADSFKVTRPLFESQESVNPPLLLRLHPSYLNIATTIQDITSAYKWRRLVFLYDNQENLIKIQNLLSDISKTSSIRETFIVQIFEKTLFEIVKMVIKIQQWTTVVASFDQTMTLKFMKAAMRCGVLNSKFTFIFANIDVHLFSMEEFAHNEANVTLLRSIIDSPHSRNWMKLARNFDNMKDNTYQTLASEVALGSKDHLAPPAKLEFDREFPIYSSSALVIDGLEILRQSVINTLPNFFAWIPVLPAPILSCTSSYPLLNNYGFSIFQQLRNATFQGLTGPIQFDYKTGLRTNITVDVMGLGTKGLLKIGDWQSNGDHQDGRTDRIISVFHWRPPQREDESIIFRLNTGADDGNALLSKALMAAQIKVISFFFKGNFYLLL